MTGVPLESMTEDKLVARAQEAMDRAVAAGRGTPGWAIQWTVYDTYADELARRAAKFMAARSDGPDR
jgi:hypothetical protein